MRKEIDIVSVIMILLGLFMINSNNNFGWFFIVVGVLKWLAEK